MEHNIRDVKIDPKHYENNFFLAVQLKDHETIERLIGKEVDVNARNGIALSTAANQGDYETVKMLLEAGAEVNHDKTKALRWAAMAGHKDIVELLMDYGATNHDLAIKAAAAKKRKQALMALFQRCDEDEQSRFAKIKKDKALLKALLFLLNNDNVKLDTMFFILIADAGNELSELIDFLQLVDCDKPKNTLSPFLQPTPFKSDKE